MVLLRATCLVVVLALAAALIGCSSSNQNSILPSVTERATWSVHDTLGFAAFGGDGQKYVYRCNTTGGDEVLLTQVTSSTSIQQGGWHPSFKPDGSVIAFASRRDGGSTAIYSMDGTDGDRKPITRLTDNTVTGEDSQPSWSADGTKIVFMTTKVIGGQGNGGADIAMMNADGSGLQYIVQTSAVEQWPVFSPDGGKIAYQLGPIGGPTDIIIRDLTAGTETNLTAALRTGSADMTRFENPAWGTIGSDQWIYFDSNRNGDFDIFRITPAGANFQQITNDPRSDGFPIISPHGDRILITRDRELWTRDPGPGTGNEVQVTHRF